MDNLIYIIYISIFTPLLLMVLLVEKRSRTPIYFLLIGMTAALFVSELNAILFGLLDVNMFAFSVRFTPITEEAIKAIPVFIFALLVSDRKETLLTIAMITGIGFAVIENTLMIINYVDSFTIFTAIIRGLGAGLMHGMCTLLIGLGVSLVRKRKKLFPIVTFALLTTAITYHAIFNMLIQSQYMMIGALFPMATYLPFFIKRLKKNKKSSAPVDELN